MALQNPHRSLFTGSPRENLVNRDAEHALALSVSSLARAASSQSSTGLGLSSLGMERTEPREPAVSDTDGRGRKAISRVFDGMKRGRSEGGRVWSQPTCENDSSVDDATSCQSKGDWPISGLWWGADRLPRPGNGERVEVKCLLRASYHTNRSPHAPEYGAWGLKFPADHHRRGPSGFTRPPRPGAVPGWARAGGSVTRGPRSACRQARPRGHSDHWP